MSDAANHREALFLVSANEGLVRFPEAIFHVDIFGRIHHHRQLAVVIQHAIFTKVCGDEFFLFLPSGQAIMVEVYMTEPSAFLADSNV